MGRRILLAGAAGAIGKRLAPLLCATGFDVVGTTCSPAKIDEMTAAGITPIVVDVFDATALARAISVAGPEIVIHQLTDLPRGLDASRMAEGNARIRSEGTRNLVAAAIAAGATRLIAQSIAWAYAPGPEPHAEDDPLDIHAEGARAITVGGVAALERQVLNAPPMAGIVLRYGQIYGPGTGADAPKGSAPLHVDGAARAALLAIDRAVPGIYNIAETTTYVAIEKARRDLGWVPGLRP